MSLIQKKYNTIFLAVLCVVLLVFIFYWIHFLTIHKYIVECFSINNNYYNDAVTHSVDLPLTTKYSCKNFCGPTSRCSITGQQCTADIDCPGCQPYSPPLPKSNQSIPGDNDAGKLTVGVTPQYSELTTGYGTQERIITNNMFSKPLMPNFGGNTWMSQFQDDKKLFDSRYKPNNMQYMPNYPNRYTLTGEFIEDGPFAANSPDLY
jgi:hypothetical protein